MNVALALDGSFRASVDGKPIQSVGAQASTRTDSFAGVGDVADVVGLGARGGVCLLLVLNVCGELIECRSLCLFASFCC